MAFNNLCGPRRYLVLVALALIPGLGCGNGAPANSNAAADPYQGLPRYVNAPGNLSPSLTDNYIDFSFAYPVGWELVPHGPQNPENFVRVTHRNPKGRSLQQFNVGNLFFKDVDANVWEQLPGFVEELNRVYPSRFSGYRKLSEGKIKFGRYDAYELRFQASIGQAIGDTVLVFRAVMIPQERSKTGAFILTYSEQGLEGGHEMETIIKSFKLGKT